MQKAANACASLRNWLSLRQRADFLRLQKNGQKWITPSFVILLSFSDDSSASPEIGLTTTKKIGNAVIRNRCRRRLRAVCDLITEEFVLGGAQISLIARAGLHDYDFEQLGKDLRWAFRRLNVPQKPVATKSEQDKIRHEQAV